MALHLRWEQLEPSFHALGYRPGLEQRRVHEALLGSRHTKDGILPATVLLAGGEQAGKSWCAANHVAVAAAVTPRQRDKPAPIFWLVGNRYEDAKREYDYIRDSLLRAELTRKGMYTAGETGPWTVRLTNGAIIKTLASDDVTVLAREAPDGIVMCEPGRQSLEAFEYLWRRAIPKTAWFLVAGTFEGSHSVWLSKLWRECQGDNSRGAVSLSLPSYANPELYPLGSRDPKFLAACQAIRDSNKSDPEEEIGERFLGIPRTPKELVFAEFQPSLHVRTAAEYVPGLPVDLAIDPGYRNAFAVLFIQHLNGQIRIFDEIYVHGFTNQEVVTEVKNHYAYPDLDLVVIDTAAKAHAGAQDPALSVWESELPVPVIHDFVHIDDRNQRIHDKLRNSIVLGQPYLVVHPRCQKTIREFTEGYKWRISRGETEQKVPIDANNHSIAALGYYIVNRFGFTDKPNRAHQPIVQASPFQNLFAIVRH